MPEKINNLHELISTHKLRANEVAFAVPAVWFRKLVKFLSENRNSSENIEFAAFNTSNLKNIYSLHQNKDFVVVNQTLYESLVEHFGGGPDIPVEVVEDPETKSAVPIVRLENYKIIYNERSVQVKLSKYRKVSDLTKLAVETLKAGTSKRFRLQMFWSNEAGEFLSPDAIICSYSVLSNISFILVEDAQEIPLSLSMALPLPRPRHQTICLQSLDRSHQTISKTQPSFRLSLTQYLNPTTDLFLQRSEFISKIPPHRRSST
jgi:hypothetical protein